MADNKYIYTEGSILKSVWKLGWPAVTSMFMETFLSITDTFWVGKLGAVEMAAVTSSMFPIWTMFSLLIIIPTGVVAIISRAVGAKETAEVSRTARQSLLFAFWIGVIFSIIGIIASPHIFKVMQTEEPVTLLGINYLRIFFLGFIFFILNETLSGIFRGVGDAKAHLIGSMTAVISNIVLDPLLIFGWGPFPRWETDGAAIATITSAALGTLVYVIMIFRGRLPYPIGFRLLAWLDLKLVGAIVRIGFPVAISWVVFSVVYIFLNRIVAGFGTESIAALMIGNRLESLSYLTCVGVSMAASTLVGQNLGANKPNRASRSAWASLGIGACVTFVITVAFLLFPRQLATFFINDDKVVTIAIEYLRILALSQIFMAAEIVLEGAFSGAGNTVPPMAVSIPGSIARLPLAYGLCYMFDFGVSGVWWALTITTWMKGMVIIYWFSLGKWKKTGLIKTE